MLFSFFLSLCLHGSALSFSVFYSAMFALGIHNNENICHVSKHNHWEPKELWKMCRDCIAAISLCRVYLAVDGYNENNGCDDDDDGDADVAGDDNDDSGCCPPISCRPLGPGGVVEKMDRMKIIKRRLSMSLRSARPVDDSLSELAEQMALEESSTARENGEKHEKVQSHTPAGISAVFAIKL